MAERSQLELTLKPSGWEKSRFIERRTTPKDERLLKELAEAIEQPDLPNSYSKHMAIATGLTGIAAIVELAGGCATITDAQMVTRAVVPATCPQIKSGYKDYYDMDGDRRGTPHNGIDIVAEMGYPIISAADGKVVVAGIHPTGGNRIVVYHGKDIDGRHISTFYGHMKEIDKSITEGKEVGRGQPLGTIGDTGPNMPKSRTPHLHFLVMVSPTGSYNIKGGQIYIDKWRDDSPHKFWLLNEKGEVTPFVRNVQYPISPIRFTYPVPCK